jgi:L-threonylcarbamoyladenylate synthase
MPLLDAADPTAMSAAAEALAAGELLAFPTETVYGLGARADDDAAVQRIYAAKSRPAAHPLIVHAADAQQARRFASQWPAAAEALAQTFWPGPLTLIVPREPSLAQAAAGGQGSIGLRVPAHPVARSLLAEALRLGVSGVAAPSANRFGRVSPTTAQHVVDELADRLVPGRDLVLDGGPCPIGVESTIVDATGPRPRLLRPGAVSVEEVAAVTGLEVDLGPGGPRAPGTLPSHYAPRARVVLAERGTAATTVAAIAESGVTVGLLGLAQVPDVTGVHRLAAPLDSAQYAHLLYDALRRGDALQLDVVVAVLPGDDSLGPAVRDRLRRAAAGSTPEAP